MLFLEACGVDWRRSAWGLDPSRSSLPALEALDPRCPRVDESFLSWLDAALLDATADTDEVDRPGAALPTGGAWSDDDRSCIRLGLAEALFDSALSDDRPLGELQGLDRIVADAAHEAEDVSVRRTPPAVRSRVTPVAP